MKDIFVARQPIFDTNQKVVGYELLYRADARARAAEGVSPEAMSSTVIVDGVLGLGLNTLAKGQKAFINFSAHMLLDGAAELLDPARIVVEILEDVEPTPELVAKVRALSESGYTIALDDFVLEDRHLPLLEVADVIKVDVVESAGRVDDMVRALAPHGVRLLAEKVENQEVHERCVQQGFELFQGFHYFRPETLSRRDLSAQSVAIVRLMKLVQDPNASDRVVEEALKADPSLTYKLLRIVNSAALGGRGVDSIGHAMRLLGREPLYRWLCLLMMTAGVGDSGVALEVVKSALLRARMCETLGDQVRSARQRDIPSGGSLFLVGLFSRADQLLGTAAEEILDEIDVSADVREAVLERSGPGGAILKAVEAYGEAEWDDATREIQVVGGTAEALTDTYLDALAWAADRLSFHAADAAA